MNAEDRVKNEDLCLDIIQQDHPEKRPSPRLKNQNLHMTDVEHGNSEEHSPSEKSKPSEANDSESVILQLEQGFENGEIPYCDSVPNAVLLNGVCICAADTMEVEDSICMKPLKNYNKGADLDPEDSVFTDPGINSASELIKRTNMDPEKYRNLHSESLTSLYRKLAEDGRIPANLTYVVSIIGTITAVVSFFRNDDGSVKILSVCTAVYFMYYFQSANNLMNGLYDERRSKLTSWIQFSVVTLILIFGGVIYLLIYYWDQFGECAGAFDAACFSLVMIPVVVCIAFFLVHYIYVVILLRRKIPAGNEADHDYFPWQAFIHEAAR